VESLNRPLIENDILKMYKYKIEQGGIQTKVGIWGLCITYNHFFYTLKENFTSNFKKKQFNSI